MPPRPVVWRAAHGGLPTAIQEQNAYPGLATRWLSRRVRHVYLGLPESRRLLRFGTPNPGLRHRQPDRAADARAAAARRASCSAWSPALPVVLVTGGSQGALAINRAVAGWLEAGGPGNAALIWVTGRGTYEEFRRYHRPPRVQVVDFLDPMADGYAVADLVVSRAGMITVAELCAWGLPSILIPLPTAAADHQTHNARVLAEAGASAHAAAVGAHPASGWARRSKRLLSEDGTRGAMAKQAQARGKPEAAAEIVSNLLTLVR